VEAYYKEITDEIQKIAYKLLDEGKVDKIIGFGKGEFTDEVTPVFIVNKENVDKLLFSEKATPFLAKYLLNYKDEKVAITAKPCETRAINSYLSENLLQRENLIIIGINGCRGIEGNTACKECDVRNPVISDYTVGEELSDEEVSSMITNVYEDLENMNPEERNEYFQNEFERCTRCYACREACPVCYCEECFTDSNQPFWLDSSTQLKDTFTFHLMRSIHMAGRCINCGACEMACPENIDVRALSAKMYRAGEEIFDYKPGMDPEQKTLLAEYDVNDQEKGFLD